VFRSKSFLSFFLAELQKELAEESWQ